MIKNKRNFLFKLPQKDCENENDLSEDDSELKYETPQCKPKEKLFPNEDDNTLEIIHENFTIDESLMGSNSSLPTDIEYKDDVGVESFVIPRRRKSQTNLLSCIDIQG